MIAPNLPTGTLTMLFTDIEGSTRLLQQLGTQAFTELVLAHREALRAAFSAHGGQEIGTEGDSFFVVFRRAGDAVAAAVEAQQRLLELPAPDGAAVRVRMGMHTGEPSLSGEGYHGVGVHRAARISSLGHGGQVLLSGTTHAVVAEELDGALALRDLGEHRLKDFEQPEHVFEVRYPGAPEASPPLKSLAAQKADPPFARRLAGSRPRRGVLVALAAAVLLAVAALVFALGRDEGPDRITADSVAVLTADGLDLAAAIPMGAAPGDIAVGEGSIWVSNADEGTVTRIDAKTRTVVQTIDVGNGPAGIAVGAGFVWVANSLDGTVSRIDPRQRGGRAQQTIRVGNQPVGVAVGEGAVWVANTADKTLSRIDPETGRPGRPISTGDGADVLAVGRSGVWVASRATDTVTQLDPRTGGEIQHFNVGHGPSALAVTADAAWVTTEFDGTLYRLDPKQGSARSTPVGASPRGVAADERTVRVTDADGVLTEVDAKTVDVEAARAPGRQAGRAGRERRRRLRPGAGVRRRAPRRDARGRGGARAGGRHGGSGRRLHALPVGAGTHHRGRAARLPPRRRDGGLRARARPRRAPAGSERRRAHARLPPAPWSPLLDRRARAGLRHPARDRAHVRHPGLARPAVLRRDRRGAGVHASATDRATSPRASWSTTAPAR